MTHALRWGLLGTARINRAVMPPIRSLPRHTLAAVASRDGERALSYAREWSIPRAFPSYEALIGDPDIDVVYIGLPNSLHAEWCIRAASAGKHVLCEKPLALTVGEVDAIASAASAAGVVVAEAFMYRHHPQTERVKALVDAGTIGPLTVVRGAFTFDLTRPHDVRWAPELGGGCLWDVGCYPVSWARVIAGRDPVDAFGWARRGAHGVDETFAGLLRFADGLIALIDAGFRSPLRTHIEIVGASGVIVLSAPYKPGARETIEIHRATGVERIEVEGQELYAGEIEDMADAVLTGRPPRVSLDDSRGNTATLVALHQSAREGRPIEVAALAAAASSAG